jgi:hypothetical protein
MNEVNEAMATFISSVVLQTTLLMMAGLIVARLFLRHAPIRHSILFGTLVCVLFSPLLTWGCLKLDWTLAEFRMPAMTSATPADRESPNGSAFVPTDTSESTPARSETTAAPSHSTEKSPAGHAAWSQGLLFVGQCVVGIWFTGTVVLSCGILRSWWKLRQVRRDVLPIDSLELSTVLPQVRQAVNVQILPPIVESHHIRSPIATGLRQPLIILPVGLCRGWTISSYSCKRWHRPYSGHIR